MMGPSQGKNEELLLKMGIKFHMQGLSKIISDSHFSQQTHVLVMDRVIIVSSCRKLHQEVPKAHLASGGGSLRGYYLLGNYRLG